MLMLKVWHVEARNLFNILSHTFAKNAFIPDQQQPSSSQTTAINASSLFHSITGTVNDHEESWRGELFRKSVRLTVIIISHMLWFQCKFGEWMEREV